VYSISDTEMNLLISIEYIREVYDKGDYIAIIADDAKVEMQSMS